MMAAQIRKAARKDRMGPKGDNQVYGVEGERLDP